MSKLPAQVPLPNCPDALEIPGGSYEERSDELLLRAMRRRIPEALGLLFDRYAAFVNAFILRILHDARLAETVLIDTFTTLWEKAESLSAEEMLPRLVRTARQFALERRPTSLPDGSEGTVELECGCGCRRFNEVLMGMPPLRRRAIELALFDGLDAGAIAASFGVPRDWAENALDSAVRQLLEALNGTEAAPGESRVGPVL